MVQTRVYAAEIGPYCIRTSCIGLGLSERSIPFRVILKACLTANIFVTRYTAFQLVVSSEPTLRMAVSLFVIPALHGFNGRDSGHRDGFLSTMQYI